MLLLRPQSVHTKYLVGLLICVFARDAVLPHIKDVRGTTLGVGVMGMLGNKGGASVRMTVFDSSMCFVCTHLAAHRGKSVVSSSSSSSNSNNSSRFLSFYTT